MPGQLPKKWYVYILRCSDGSLYTGTTTDLERRLQAHKSGKGARYTKARGAEELEYYSEHPDKSAALIREHEIKRLSKQQKLVLISARNKKHTE